MHLRDVLEVLVLVLIMVELYHLRGHQRQMIQQEHKLQDHMSKLDGTLQEMDSHVSAIEKHMLTMQEHMTLYERHVRKLDDHVTKLDDHLAGVRARFLPSSLGEPPEPE